MIIESNSQPRIGGRPSAPGTTATGGQFTINLAEQTSAADKLAAALADFKREAQKTPRERCRDQVMKEWHLTQDMIDALPPKEAQELNEQINEEVSRRMQCAEPSTSSAADTSMPQGMAALDLCDPIATMDLLGMRRGATTSAISDGS